MGGTDSAVSTASRSGLDAAGSGRMEKVRTVLLVEPDDEIARRLVEAAWSYRGLLPIQVAEIRQARRALAEHDVDVVVSEASLPDGNGFRFLAELRRETRTRDLPFLFLADDSRLKAKVAALRMGAHDYLVKPVAIGELCARIVAAVERVEVARAAVQERAFNLAGDFTGMGFSELVGLLNSGRRSGRLSVETQRGRGQLVFVDGQIFHVTFGDVWGESAFYAILFEPDGRFEFLVEKLDRNSVPNTIALSPTALLVEGARRLDEAVLHGEAPEIVRPNRVWTSPEPDVSLAKACADAVSDPANDAEVVLREGEELETWSGDPCDGRRLLAGVVAPSHRLPSWLRESAPCDMDGLFTSALGSGPAVPCLSWLGPDGVRFDVLLFDQRAPAAVLESMRGEIAFLIVAPASGRWRELGIRARAELSSLLARLQPRAVFGVGDEELETRLAELLEQVDSDAPCARLDDEPSLRGWLSRALTQWAGAV